MISKISIHMKLPSHPSQTLNDELSRSIRALSADAEEIKQLHPAQLQIILQQKWFNLFVPKQYGGLELCLPDGLQLEEALAWTDGSVGWTVTLCSGANWFIGFLQQDAAADIFKDPKVCLAGSGRPSGIAKITPTGYEITGNWNYVTGTPHATIFTANCVVEKDGLILLDEDDPLVLSFWFSRQEVCIHENWNSIGLVATASHGF